MALEALGVATFVVATEQFVDLARRLAASEGFEARLIVVDHPLGGVAAEDVAARARAAAEEIVTVLRGARRGRAAGL